MAIDALAAAEGISVTTTQQRALVGRGVVAGKQARTAVPLRFCSAAALLRLHA